MTSDTDRDSLYLDTLSFKSGSSNYYRKSLTLSQRTIYHSAEDLQSNLSLKDIGNGQFLEEERYRSYGGFDEIDQMSSSHRQSITVDKDEVWRTFSDGERTVDYVLAYPCEDKNSENEPKRIEFCKNLDAEGLELEYDRTQRIHFVKIHAPREILRKYAELLRWEMPISSKHFTSEDIIDTKNIVMENIKKYVAKLLQLDSDTFKNRGPQIYHEYSRDKEYLFDVEDPKFFTEDVKIAVINFILERTSFIENTSEEDAPEGVGIQKLLNDKVFKDAYPLHDGVLADINSNRVTLLNEWASMGKWIQHQPLTEIKEYFGAQIALYFAWLGFYTHMLIPASIFGIICFSFGLFKMFSSPLSEEICAANNTVLMCPQCDSKCDYWRLSETCLFSRLSNLFDNRFTAFFALLMSIWTALYLELWKRYSAKLIHSWGLTNYTMKTDPPRPEYTAQLKKLKAIIKSNTGPNGEPQVPYWRVKFPRHLISYSIIFIFITVAIISVFGVILYRMSLNTAQNIYGNTESMTYKITILPVTAAIINLVVITLLNFLYDYLAVILTNIEMKRTQAEYDESLSLKIYLFQFVNYYSSIFYIAFLKGKFIGYPAKYNRIFGFRQEECAPGGCMMELFIQLAIIMIGKQILTTILELLIPFLKKTFLALWHRMGLTQEERDDSVHLKVHNQWTEDFKLISWRSLSIFDEYLEMVIQYGFVTLFVVAFPLASFFALVNNIFEMRLDAKKFLKYYRRPIPRRVRDIGTWHQIMQIICRLAIMSNAFIIAFSSNLIPELVHSFYLKKEMAMPSYMNFTLAKFATKDFQMGPPVNSSFGEVEFCYYSEFRNPPEEGDAKYKKNLVYWHVLAARLAFIVVFQNIVGIVQLIVDWAIPDVPRIVRDKSKREDYLKSNIILREERKKLPKLAKSKLSTLFSNATKDGILRKRPKSSPPISENIDESSAEGTEQQSTSPPNT